MTPSMIRTHGPHTRPRKANSTGEDTGEMRPPMPMLAPDTEGGGGLRLISYLKYHWMLILLVGGLLGGGLGFAAWELIPSKYTSYALIRVAMADEAVFESRNSIRNDFIVYLKTQAQIIKSNRVLTGAIRDQAIADTRMIREQDDPVRFLEEELKIEFSENSEIIKLGLSGEDSQVITKILNGIQQSYFKLEVEEETKKRNDTFLRYEQMHQREEAALLAKYEALKNAEGSEALPADPTEPIKKSQLAAAQMLKLQESLFKVDGDISGQKRRIALLQTRLSNPPVEVLTTPEIAPAPIDYERDPDYAEQEQKIRATQSKIDYLAKLSGDPNSPAIQRMQTTIAEARGIQETIKSKKAAPIAQQASNAQLQLYKIRMTEEIQNAQLILADFEEMKTRTEQAIVTVKASMPTIATDRIIETPDFLRADIRHREEMVGRLKDKVNIARLEVQTQPRVRLLQAATVPQKREFKKQVVATAGAGLMGFVMVGLMVVVYESRVRRVMNLKDVRQIARGPILGVIPSVPSAQVGKVRNFQAMAALNEAIDKTRTLTMQHATQSGLKTIMITSSLEDEAKAFLTGQLTMSFVKSGCRTLLIDFDLRTPSMHDYFGVPNEKGICEVLRGEADLRNSIQTFSDGLCFLAAGKWNEQVRQELVGDKIALMLARVREHFDCIILHAHPLLAVPDSYLIAQHTDMVIVTTLKNVTRLPMLENAQEKILQSGTNTVGFVFLGASDEETLC